MAKNIGKWTRIWIEGYDLQTSANDVTFPRAHDEVETSGYGQDKQYLAGQADSGITLDGYFDSATNKTHDALKALAGGDSSKIVTVAIGANADVTTGSPTFHLDTNQMTYEAHPELGGPTAAHGEWKSRDFALEYGKLLFQGNATQNSNGPSLDNAASSATGGAGYLHITATSAGDAITAKVQHSTNNSAWSTLLSFTLTGAAIDAQRVATASITTTVNRYVRAQWTVSGASIVFPIAVAFVRN